MAEGTQEEDPVMAEDSEESGEQLEGLAAGGTGEEPTVVRRREKICAPVVEGPKTRQQRPVDTGGEWWFSPTLGLPEDGRGRRLAPSFTGWRECRVTGDYEEEWSCSTAPGQYTLDVLRDQFGERIYPATIHSPSKDSRPYTSQFRLSGTELNLHPDDQFTLREPTTRQVGTDRTRYGMGVRGLGDRPADPDDMGAGPTGGGAGTRPRPSLEAGRYGGQVPPPWPQNMVWNPPPITLTFDGDPDRLAVFLSHVLNHLDRYSTLYSSNWSMVVAVTSSLQGEAAAWAADLYSDQARELADVGLFLDALRIRFEDPTRLQWAEAQLVGLRQRGRPAKDYIREFQKLAGRLRSWPDRLLVHHFCNGLDNEIRRACIVRGIGGRLSDWFKAAMELDIGLREHTSGRENRLPPRRGQDPPTGRMVQATPEATRPKTTFRCFRCNRPGHRAAECGLPAILGTPTAIGKPGSTPQKTTEKSRVAHQTGQTPIQPASGDHSPMLQEYEEDGPVEDSMVSEPIVPFTIPVTLTSPNTGEARSFQALLDTGCTRCLINRGVAQQMGIRVTRLKSPIRFEQVDGSLLGGAPTTLVTEPVRMDVGGHWEVIRFIVVPSMTEPLILGLAWLDK
ncbi:UDP-GlcNAc:betaGal beta-1,3-N-acetylglucosaminyltransferase-like protein 1 isoform X1 [Crotalus tigris]|uniref:UDP-GlcNAc:betaGal beta-1,3-N-acetylglucosaminyltransferase-like protein 1 isoform X1 n=1 Tax=Crotalus tigris TaxID=88082 RepID=UPI00192F6A19|nr:UDP-GlcNAc:betaGal beta-1,3-N-acetylglucosaminyltransferase-like protein 1 isoform X1 [Crotalus tigris]XP_039191767.1 UDP-GlcNAc:betaGal beta-1,3-N-acetylglucosaminyltransferase-like protein 1 isoform X1 [Crotalus tigris]XP_039191768.1 UDP-GlcNAc:betaGal beta-1,3-N-acetylglucosaminyltransferase-like protein 1 isoform X1 [Crotalus tigris]